jgi:hypothetical protein
MANTIKIKRSAVPGKVPTTSDLALGELGLNTWEGKLYTKKDNGTASIVELSGGGGGGGTAGPILEPAYVISENVTLGTNRHGLSLTSVEVSSGYSVTVPAGATWTIAAL